MTDYRKELAIPPGIADSVAQWLIQYTDPDDWMLHPDYHIVFFSAGTEIAFRLTFADEIN